MPDYRLYFLDPHSGHFDGVEEFYASDHVAAICLIQERETSVPMELWCGGRKVARFDGKPDMAANEGAERAISDSEPGVLLA